MRKIISVLMSCSFIFLNMSVYAVGPLNNAERIRELSGTIIGHFEVNNTGYLSKTNPYAQNKTYIPAAMRYVHSTPEMRYQGIHGLYPARTSLDVNNTIIVIRELAALDINNTRLERVLTPVLYNPYIHEAVYIESLLTLYSIEGLNPETKKTVAKDLTFLTKFADHELIAGTGREVDSRIRSRIYETLGRKDDSVIKKEDLAQFNIKRAEIAQAVGVAGLLYSVATLGAGLKSGLSSGGASAANAPKGNANLRIIKGGGSSGNTAGNVQFGNTIKAPASNAPSTGVRASAYEGGAAVKLNPQPEVAPMRIIKTETAPSAQTQSAVAKVRNYSANTNTPFVSPFMPSIEGKTSMYIGDPLDPNRKRKLSKEEAEQRIARGLEISEEELFGLPAGDSYDLLQKARQRGLLKASDKKPATGALGITNSAADNSSNGSSANPEDKKVKSTKLQEELDEIAAGTIAYEEWLRSLSVSLNKYESQLKEIRSNYYSVSKKMEKLSALKERINFLIREGAYSSFDAKRAKGLLLQVQSEIQQLKEDNYGWFYYGLITDYPGMMTYDEFLANRPDINANAYKADEVDFNTDTAWEREAEFLPYDDVLSFEYLSEEEKAEVKRVNAPERKAAWERLTKNLINSAQSIMKRGTPDYYKEAKHSLFTSDFFLNADSPLFEEERDIVSNALTKLKNTGDEYQVLSEDKLFDLVNVKKKEKEFLKNLRKSLPFLNEALIEQRLEALSADNSGDPDYDSFYEKIISRQEELFKEEVSKSKENKGIKFNSFFRDIEALEKAVESFPPNYHIDISGLLKDYKKLGSELRYYSNNLSKQLTALARFKLKYSKSEAAAEPSVTALNAEEAKIVEDLSAESKMRADIAAKTTKKLLDYAERIFVYNTDPAYYENIYNEIKNDHGGYTSEERVFLLRHNLKTSAPNLFELKNRARDLKAAAEHGYIYAVDIKKFYEDALKRDFRYGAVMDKELLSARKEEVSKMSFLTEPSQEFYEFFRTREYDIIKEALGKKNNATEYYSLNIPYFYGGLGFLVDLRSEEESLKKLLTGIKRGSPKVFITHKDLVAKIAEFKPEIQEDINTYQKSVQVTVAPSIIPVKDAAISDPKPVEDKTLPAEEAKPEIQATTGGGNTDADISTPKPVIDNSLSSEEAKPEIQTTTSGGNTDADIDSKVSAGKNVSLMDKVKSWFKKK